MIFHWILPELRSDRQVPDIAVTLPSPQTSTTDLFIQWINEETEHAAYGNLKHFKEEHLSAFDHTIRYENPKGIGDFDDDEKADDGVPKRKIKPPAAPAPRLPAIVEQVTEIQKKPKSA
jgi:hypothetical protein